METADSSVVGSKKAGRADGWLAANSAGRSISRTPLPSARNTASSFPRSAISVISMKASRFITGLAKASLWRQPPRWPPTRFGMRPCSSWRTLLEQTLLAEPVRHRGKLRQGDMATNGVARPGLLHGRRDAVADRADAPGAAIGELASSRHRIRARDWRRGGRRGVCRSAGRRTAAARYKDDKAAAARRRPAPSSTMVPWYMTATRSAMWAMTPISWLMNR